VSGGELPEIHSKPGSPGFFFAKTGNHNTTIKSVFAPVIKKSIMTVEDLISELKPAIAMAKSKVFELRGLL
jgi:hypothetical protein